MDNSFLGRKAGRSCDLLNELEPSISMNTIHPQEES